MADWTYDELKAGREKAKAAGDQKAVQLFNKKLEGTPQFIQEWRQNAAKDGNAAAVDAITKRYYKARGKYRNGSEIKKDPVFQQDAQALSGIIKGEPIEDPEEAADWALSFRRDLDSSDIGIGTQLYRWQQGDISEEERHVLRRMEHGYQNIGMSLGGVVEHTVNALNPFESPSVIAGGVVGKGLTRLGAGAAVRGLRKKIMTGAGANLTKGSAREAAEDAAGAGVRTLGQRVRRGAAVGAGAGAGYGAAGDAAVQSFETEDGQYDPQRGRSAALVGAGIGAVGGGALGGVTNRSGKRIQQAKEQALGGSAYSGEAMSRLMTKTLEKAGKLNDPADVEALERGDVAGVYRRLMADEEMSPDDVRGVFKEAGQEAVREYDQYVDEIKAISKEYGLPKLLVDEATDARKLARDPETTPNTIGKSIRGLPEYQNMPDDVKAQMDSNLGRLSEAADQMSQIAKFTADTFQNPGVLEQIFNAPEFNVLVDILPKGYVASRGAGRLMKLGREKRAPIRFQETLKGASELTPESAIGPNMARRARARSDAFGSAPRMSEDALQASRRVAQDSQRAAQARYHALRQKRREVLRESKRAQERDPDFFKRGGPQAQIALTHGAPARKVREYMEEGLKSDKYTPKQKEWAMDWLELFENNINTKEGLVTGDPKLEDDLYWHIVQPAIRTGRRDKIGGDVSKELADLVEVRKDIDEMLEFGSGVADKTRELAEDRIKPLDEKIENLKAVLRAGAKSKAKAKKGTDKKAYNEARAAAREAAKQQARTEASKAAEEAAEAIFGPGPAVRVRPAMSPQMPQQLDVSRAARAAKARATMRPQRAPQGPQPAPQGPPRQQQGQPQGPPPQVLTRIKELQSKAELSMEEAKELTRLRKLLKPK